MDSDVLEVSIIYPVSNVVSGYGNYATRLISGLESVNGIRVQKIPVRKSEITFMGRPLLGTASQMVSSRVKRPTGKVVHSLAPTVINKRTSVVTLHDLVPLLMKREFADTYYRKKGYDAIFNAVKSVPQVIVFTEYGKNELVEQFHTDPEKISVVRQSIDHRIFYPEPDKSLKGDSRSLIVTVGDMNPRKKYDILFRAAGGKDNVRVVHIGPVNAWNQRNDELRKIASEYSNIEFAGKLSDSELRKYMSTADLLVHLSEGEGFGSTTVEAMACGTNVLVNDLPIFHETLGNMAFFTSLDAEDVSGSIDNALKNRKDSKELVSYSRGYSIEQMGSNTAEVYRKIANLAPSKH